MTSQGLDGLDVARGAQSLDHAGGDVQAPGLQHPRDQGHAHQRVVGGAPRHLPEPVVGGKVPVVVAQIEQALTHQAEVLGLLGRHLHPVRVERSRQGAEALDGVPGQVDGVEFDMGDRVDQGCMPLDVG